jgi:hypothetical protein
MSHQSPSGKNFWVKSAHGRRQSGNHRLAEHHANRTAGSVQSIFLSPLESGSGSRSSADCTRNSSLIGSAIRFLRAMRFGGEQGSSRFNHTSKLAKDRISRWVQIEDAIDDNNVNLSISDRQPFCVGFSKFYIDDTRFGDGLASTR